MIYSVKRWTLQHCYMGAHWDNCYSSGVGRSRDSSCLEESNFDAMLKILGESEKETVQIVRESHWLVGWVEWIAIHESDEKSLATAREACERLNNYPVLDEEDFSAREWEKSANYWDALSPREKAQMAMDERKRCHWLKNKPVWPFGCWSYSDLVDHSDETIAQGICESLRE